MAIRKTRRQVVLDAAGIAAIYAAGWGQQPAPVAATVPPPATGINDTMRALVAQFNQERREDDIPGDALHDSYTLGYLWSDLCTLTGEELPADVAAMLDGPAAELVEPGPPLVTFPPDADSLSLRLAYLTGLVARWDRLAAKGDAHAASMLASVNRCLDLPIDCLDGSFGRKVFGVGKAVQA